MKTFLSFFGLLSLVGLLFTIGCASESEQGGTSSTRESNHGQYNSPHHTPDSDDRGDYWSRGPWF